MTIIRRLLQQVQAAPQAPAVIDDQQALTYAELSAAAVAVARQAAGQTDRQFVGIALPTSAAFPCAFFGALAAGKAAVPINSLLTPDVLAHVVRDAGLDTIITSSVFRETFAPLDVNTVLIEDLLDTRSDSDPAEHLAAPGADKHPNDPAMIIYTSGTSGAPKGVVLTDRNLLANVDSSAERYDYGAGDITLGVLPLSHAFASTCSMLLPLLLGGRAVYQAKFVPQKVLAAIAQHRVTALFAVPSMFRLLARSPRAAGADVSSLRFCVAGGEALGGDVARDLEQAFGIPLLEGYGMSEASPVVSVNPPDKPKAGSVGVPLSWAQIKVAADDGTEAPAGGEGEIWIRGDCIMKGYHNDPAATAQAITPDGWLRTGDIGRLDEEGYLYITGRRKELIISGGENISPVEIEDVIAGHRAVAEAAVIPVPDDARGEVPKAFVVLREGATCTEREILAHCREHLPRVKWPRAAEFIDKMPRSPAGKLLRRMLGR